MNFEDANLWNVLKNEEHSNHTSLLKFIECLGVCHTVIVESKEIKGVQTKVYNASSPDELALVNGMRHFGFSFVDRDVEDNIVIEYKNETLKYKLLHVIEFTSDRKRMSVVVKTPD